MLAYESLSLFTDAYKCFNIPHFWRESLYCAMMVPLPQEELKAHATNLATSLVEENHDYVSAATIHVEHLHDVETAAQLLTRGSRFADAVRLLALNGKEALIPDIVDNGLADAMGSMTDLLADFRSQITAQVPRFRELRIRRTEDPLAYFGGDPTTGEGVDIPDNVSLAPTEATTLAGRSMFTRYTANTASSRQTSRTRRREERKRARGKKGTVYEEEYLVNSVRRLIERANSTVSEVETLVDALLRRGMRERAAAIEKASLDVLRMCGEAREEVFEIPAQEAGLKGDDQNAENMNGADGQEEVRPAGGQGVFWDSVVSTSATGKPKDPPPVKEMKKSTLLS